MKKAAKCCLAAVLVSAVLGACTDSGDESAFCDTARELEALAEEEAAFNTLTDEGDMASGFAEFREQLENQSEKAEELMVRLERTAPGEIEEDVELIVDLSLRFIERLRDADYNPAVLFAAGDLVAEAGEERVNQAAQRVGDYLQEECGIDTDRFTGFGVDAGSETVPPPAPPAAPTPPTPPTAPAPPPAPTAPTAPPPPPPPSDG